MLLHIARVGNSEASNLKSENHLMLISDHDCICPGYKLTLEYSVNGTPFGTTVWHGDFFDCSDGIILLHNQHRFTAEGQE